STLPFQSSPRESKNELGFQGESQRGGMTGGAVSSPLNLVMEHGVAARVRGEGNTKEAFVVEVRISMEAREEGMDKNGSMRVKNKSSRGKNKKS
ncbi:hypothetical protein VIGAN_02177800, partial [Vigna angularis var. angularis]